MTQENQPEFIRRDKDMPLRVAKRIARAGICSRREAETLIEQGEVSVNGKTLTSPAVNVIPSDKIMVRGKLLPVEESMRLWRYYKPRGLIVSNHDEKGRPTIFEDMPEDMPRVISIGRLDYDSEGLLLLTNDGELARHLELPSTGWLRKYRVRVFGQVDQAQLAELEHGITIDGVHYDQLLARLDKQMPTNAWLTIAIREGKNREIRRVMEHLGYPVSRLIRLSYGPYQLGKMSERDVIEVKQSVLYEQLGLEAPEEDTNAPRKRVAGKLSLYRGVRTERKASSEEGRDRGRGSDRGSARGSDRGSRGPNRDDRGRPDRRDDRRGPDRRDDRRGPDRRDDRRDNGRDNGRGPDRRGFGQKRFGDDKKFGSDGGRPQRGGERREGQHSRSEGRPNGRPNNRPYGRSDNRSEGRSERRSEGRSERWSEGRPQGRSDNRFWGRSEDRRGNQGRDRRNGTGTERHNNRPNNPFGDKRFSDRPRGQDGRSGRPSSSKPVRDQKNGHAHHRRPGPRH